MIQNQFEIINLLAIRIIENNYWNNLKRLKVLE